MRWRPVPSRDHLFSSICAQNRNAEGEITNGVAIAAWEKKNTTAMKNIYAAIKEEQSRILMSCNSALEMWTRLETEYTEAAGDSAPMLWSKFYGCKFQPGQSVMGFITEVEQVVSRLRSINIVIEDDQIITKILMSLPSSLKLSFGVAWDSAPAAEKTLRKLTTRLVRLEKSIKQQSEEEKAGVSGDAFISKKNICPEQEEQAFPTQGHRGGNPGRDKKRECWECGESNHIRAKCRAYKRRLDEEQEERDRKRRRYDKRDQKDDNRPRRTDDKKRRHDDRDRKEGNRNWRGDNEDRNRRGYSYKSSTRDNGNK